MADFDLQPDPRILPMLGEINLQQWRCLAELVDNSVDGFLDVLASGGVLSVPEVHVTVPMTDAPSGQVTVSDNGPGMGAEVLERAVRAGWSGNSSVTGKLGLFGMGFNIATARLGTVTTVWTTRDGDPEWVGVKIDFDQLRQQRHFRTPKLTQAKTVPSQHGTKITIEKLKPEQRQWFAKNANRTSIRRELSRVYSSMLQPGGVPLQFKLVFEGRTVEPRRHCVWSGPGNQARTVDTGPRFGVVDAYQPVDVQMEDRLYCLACWQWLASDERECPVCGVAKDVVARKRTIRGWLGIQRYLSETDFGVDFIRNGRKIEIGSKDLFVWADGDRTEPEYPIDDPRNRGRIVGEIHLDHCRVTYTKDRFERTDPAWEDMVKAVRGEGPLRPDKADNLGFGPNSTPLFKLFQVFRRSTPKSKVAKAWQKLIVVPDNNVAEEMAKRFHQGDAGFQTDQKWWDLVVAEDLRLLTGGGATRTGGGAPVPGGGETAASVQLGIPGFTPGAPSPSSGAAEAVGAYGQSGSTHTAAPPPRQTVLPAMSLRYTCASLHLQWSIQAYDVDEAHPQLVRRRPWFLKANTTGVHEFFVNSGHPVFASATLTPLDALLAELAYAAMDEQRNRQGVTATFGSVLAELREQYATTSALEPTVLSTEARQLLQEIAQAVASRIPNPEAAALFRDLPDADQRAVLDRMVRRNAQNPQSITTSGKFLEYAPPSVLRAFYAEHPDLFFDGSVWEEAYGSINFNDADATESAREQVTRRYQALLEDAVWLAEQDPRDIAEASRPKLLRALYALELLAPVESEDAARS